MTVLEFNRERNITVVVDDETFKFDSYHEMLGFFETTKNTKQWAISFNNLVLVAHENTKVGHLVESFESNELAEVYTMHLNEYYAICEKYSVIESKSENRFEFDIDKEEF